jgi:hypothetical protein
MKDTLASNTGTIRFCGSEKPAAATPQRHLVRYFKVLQHSELTHVSQQISHCFKLSLATIIQESEIVDCYNPSSIDR